jgi:GTP diphosphokinase / guanosine-3',5'-bis(diphosphate) 3'-diphosphatase
MSVLTKTEESLITSQFEDLLKHCSRYESKMDQRMIRKAFKFANEAHKGARRRSGEPYILHPIAVAKVVSYEMGLGTKSVVCALLHDVVEDTDFTIEDIENQFGKKVASIIDGLTKISDVFDNQSSLQAENFRKMLLTLSDDVRVILIKLADRLHNMRTLDSLPPNKQIKLCGETIYLYAPLAHRLGLYAIKSELEDLSLKYRYPKIYEDLVNKVRDNEKKRQTMINTFALPIIIKLENAGFNFDISGRPKSIYSIWNKMQLKGIPFEEVYDLLAIRIVFEPLPDIPEKTQCWTIYSLITDTYMPKPDRIRDWVSTPKANGYEALHVTVMGPSGNWVEVQIRSKRMDEIAERGFAAHWQYKHTGGGGSSELDKWLKKIRELLENPNSDALEFLDDFKLNLFSSEILIFTPKGKIISLPKDSTALDFAYEIHTEIGNKAIGAKVNHRLLPLNHRLNSGDQIEILTSDSQKVQPDWFNSVITAKAKSAIKAAIKADSKNRIETGKKILEDKLKEYNLKPSSRIFRKLLPEYEVISKDELYSKIGSGIITLTDLKKILKKNTKNKWIRYWGLQFGFVSRTIKDVSKPPPKPEDQGKNKDYYVIRENPDETEHEYVLAKCCNPIPGDNVIGYRDHDNTIIIHKAKCQNAIKLMSSEGNRIIQANWTTHKILSYLVRISIGGVDKFGIYNNITTVISKELAVNMRNINLASHDGIFDGTLDLYVHNTTDLNNLILNLSKIKGVESVKRVETMEE